MIIRPANSVFVVSERGDKKPNFGLFYAAYCRSLLDLSKYKNLFNISRRIFSITRVFVNHI